MADWRNILGVNVKKLRKESLLTQEELAFRVGIDITYIGGIERGKRNPSMLVMVKLTDVLGCEIQELLYV